MKIAMVGSGDVGLVSGACFADFGHHVVCIDKYQSKIDWLHPGVVPIYEPGPDALVETNVNVGWLSFTTDLAEGIKGAAAIFIAVAEEVGASLANDAVAVIKSTVPVGTGDEVERIIGANGTPHRVSVVPNPEFLLEGAAIGDFKRPDRIVIGAEEEFGREVMREVYRPLYLNESPILFTVRRTSELIKYAANAFLATKITFINVMADLCEQVGADVQDVSRGIGMNGRIGWKFFHAGPGYGGSCFPKHMLALLKTAEDYDSPVRIIEAVAKVNESRKRAMGRRVVDALGGLAAARGKQVALLGLTFKPNTHDMRDSPSIAIAQTLADAGVSIAAYDPERMEQARPLMPELAMCDHPYTAIEGADAIVIVNKWDAFRALDLERVKALAKAPLLIDLRSIYKPDDMCAARFEYTSVGRP